MSDANGTRKEWRDTSAAQIARLEPEKVAMRLEIAERMLRQGAKHADIRAATRAETGTAIGGGGLTRLRRQLEREAGREERRKARETAGAKPRREPMPPPPAGVRLDGPIETLIAALLKARIPFTFDGSAISLKAGG